MSSIVWQPSWAAARASAKASKLPMMLDFWDPG